jgi:hypothetical protein
LKLKRQVEESKNERATEYIYKNIDKDNLWIN